MTTITSFVRFALSASASILLFSFTAWGQGGRELPIEKPRERTTNEAPKVKAPVRQAPNTSTVVVLLNPIVPGQVTVKSTAGKLIKQGEADIEGQVSFSLARGLSYQVEATSPGYSSGSAQVKPAKDVETVRISLNAESRVIRLQNFPTGGEVLIDNKVIQPNTVGGLTTVAGVTPSKHKVMVRHPDYNDYKIDVDLSRMSIGELLTIPITLERVARLTIQSVAGAEIMIDGAVFGRVPASGTVTIAYAVSQQAAEHLISAEKPGYITKSLRERLAPGPHTLNLDLEPFANPEGASDGFDNLNQWGAPATWKPISTASNRTLQISGTQLGLLKGKMYKDFQSVFTLWMPDGKGATWGVKADQAGKNYYLFHLSGPKAIAPFLPNRFYSFVVKDGGEPVEVNPPTPLVVDLTPTSSFLIHIVATGYTIEHSITSNETGEKVTLGRYTDSTTSRDKFLYGLFGFRSFPGEAFIIDDFTIDPSSGAVTTKPR
jgi:hypothetical protein